MKIAMLLAIVLVFACPLIGYAQNPVLKPGEAAIYITDDGEHLSVMISKIGLDGAQILEQRRMIKRNDEVQPNVVVCSIDKLGAVMPGLNQANTMQTVNSLNSENADATTFMADEVITQRLAVETVRSKIDPKPQPRRVVKKAVPQKQVLTPVNSMAPKQVATVRKTEESKPSTQPSSVPAGTSTGNQPGDTPPPPPAITVTERFTALGIMIASLSLLLLALIVIGSLIDRRELKQLRKDLAAVYEANYQAQERLKTIVAIKQQLDRPPVEPNETAIMEPVSEVTQALPTAEATDEMLIPTIENIPSVSADTGKILSPDTANLTESLQEEPETEQVARKSERGGTLTIQASEPYLNQCLAQVYEVKPQVEGWLSDVILALHPDATTDDVDETIKALLHERIDNSLFFAGIKQITIGHPRSCFVTGKHNEHLVLKSGTKSWHVAHKIWERSQMESPANKPEEGDLKIAVNHSYKKEE